MYGLASLVIVLAAAPTPPKLDISDSDFAARVRQRVADRLNAPRSWANETPPDVIVAPRFLYIRDRALSLPSPPWFGDAAYAAAFELVHEAWYSSQPDRVRAIIVFSSFDDGGGALFYLAMANDVAGLGQGQPAQLFDDTPNSMLDGFVWLGDVDALESAGDAYFREAFIHEIAHRWCAYADVRVADRPDLAPDLLRGRQSMHWSYFVESGESPMEGNGWRYDRESDSYVTAFQSPPQFRFSPLDLYFMGVLRPELVPPFVVLETFSAIEPANANPQKDSPPAHRRGVPVRGHAGSVVRVTIEDVIAGSGLRTPAATDEPIVWPIGIVLLSNGLDRVRFEELVRLDQHIAELTSDFEDATGGRITLDLAIEGAGRKNFGEPCADVDECDRTRSDRCEPIREGGHAVCTRTCEADPDCGIGFCCGKLPSSVPSNATGPGSRSICIAGARCSDGEVVDPEKPETPMPPPEVIVPGELDTSAEPQSCACSETNADQRGGGALIVLLSVVHLWWRGRKYSRVA